MIKKKVRVTIEKEFLLEFPNKIGTDEYIKDWNESLWHINGIDDIASYAAIEAATGNQGYDLDGIGLLTQYRSDLKEGEVFGVYFDELYSDIETEIIDLMSYEK